MGQRYIPAIRTGIYGLQVYIKNLFVKIYRSVQINLAFL